MTEINKQATTKTVDDSETAQADSQDLKESKQEGLRRDTSSTIEQPAAHAQSRSETSKTDLPRERMDSALPRRPEGPVPPQSDLDRHRFPRHIDGRESRDGRLGRGDRHMDSSRDFSIHGRRGPEQGRDFNRFQERGVLSDRERHEPARHPIDSSRGFRDRNSADNARAEESNGRLPENGTRESSGQGPRINPERLSLLDQRQDSVNPLRAALISENIEPIKAGPPGSREVRTERANSRPSSPRGDRFGADRDRPEGRWSDYGPTNRLSGPEFQDPSRRRDAAYPPSGPRDRPNDRGPIERNRNASAFTPSPQQSRPLNPDHGRLTQPPDSEFGRLNPAPIPDVPSGPRDRNSRIGGSRISSAPQPRGESRNSRQEPIVPLGHDRGPPTGPASTRNQRGNVSGEFAAQQPASAPSPTTSVVSGVHPDRLAHLPPQALAPPPPAPIEVGVHPDRLRAIQGDNVAPPQRSNLRTGPGQSPQLGSAPPSGPRSAQSNNNSSPVGVTPTGPSLNNDRSNRPNRSFAGMQKILTQAGQQPVPDRPGNDRITNIRGRSNRNSLTGQDSVSASGPPTPTGPASRQEFPRDSNATNDLINTRPINAVDEERESRDGGRERDSGVHGRDGRRSRRSSADRSAGRERERRDRERVPQDGDRGRRGGHRGERESHSRGAGRDDREVLRARESVPNGSERPAGRREAEKVHDDLPPPPPPPPRDVPEWRGPPRDHGRRGPEMRGGEDRRGGRGRDDGSGRKRHSEGSNMDNRGDKRPRR